MKVLILFAHPAFQKSTINKALTDGIEQIENVTFHDLYEEYPEMDIDIDREQQLLTEHDCIVFMHPMYWYSTPAIFKEWQDLVLEHGWAYGSKGNALAGKLFFLAITTGAPKEVFQKGELQNYSVKEFLAPLIQTGTFCKMNVIPPFVTHGSHILEGERLMHYKEQYHKLLKHITENKLDAEKVKKYEYLNHYIKEV